MTTVVSDDHLRIERLQLGAFGTNAYLLVGKETGESAVVDAPDEAEKIIARLKGTTPLYILLTHSHMDHIGALGELCSELKVPLAAHAADSNALSPPPEIMLNQSDTITLGKIQVYVLHTPGHTPGSLCFKTNNYLLSGDTLFPGGPGRTNTPADFAQVVKSITGKLFTMDDDTQVYPGHGEPTTIKQAKDEFAAFSSRPHRSDLCGDVLWLTS